MAIEEQFYALWPVVILAVTWVTRRFFTRRRALSLFLAVVIVASLFDSVTLTRSSPSWAYFGFQTRAWELALGALVAINAEWLTQAITSIADFLSWVGLAAIVLPALLFNSATAYPGIAVALPVTGTVLMIAAGSAPERRGAGLLIGRRPFQFVGRISYSWYLWHWPVFIFLPLVLGHRSTTANTLVAIVISFTLASISFAVVEQPFRKNFRPLATGRSWDWGSGPTSSLSQLSPPSWP